MEVDECSSQLEALEDVVIGIQSSLHSIEMFTRNVGKVQRGSQENEEIVSTIKGLTATAKSLEKKLQSL